MDRIAPPQEHDHHRWHWIDTTNGLMCASWYPKASNVGTWDISGQAFYADAPLPNREWKYIGPAIPPPENWAKPITIKILWAAMAAMVLDIHAPQDQLSESEWSSARNIFDQLDNSMNQVKD